MFYLTHLHSAYSFSDSLITPAKLVKRLGELGMNKVAITDHGNLLHTQEYRQALQKNNIQHFPGCEFYYCDDITNKEQRRSYHLTAIAKTEQGVKNLYTLSSLSYEKGFYYKPRIDFKLIQQYSEGIVFSSACLAGQLDRLLLEKEPLKALEVAQKFKNLLGDRYFIEIMPHNIPEQQEVNPLLIELAKKLDIKLIATCDSHYTYQDEVQNRRMLLMMNKSGWAKDEEVGACDTIYMMSKDDIKNTFKMYHQNIEEDIIDEAIANTGMVLDGEAPNVAFDKARFPKFDIPREYKNEEEYFNRLIIDGLKNKNLFNKVEYLQRAEREAKVIKSAGFINYFLVEYDLFNWCRKNKLYTGIARGSAGGSLIAYLLNITRIDPLQYDLLFERFYNEGRNTGTAENCPDIDSDFESSRREEVIKYLESKYGEGNVSQICNIGYIKLKSGIKDVARVLQIPIDVSNKISQEVDWESYHNLDEAIENDTKARLMVEKYPELFKYVKIFCGIPRQTGKHAAGIVIGDEKIGNICPMMLATVNGEKFLVSQFDKESIKHTGLIKFDILGLTTMDFIHAIDEQVKEETGKYVDWDSIPLDDKNIYEKIYGKAETDYVFQCDTDSMKNLLLKMQCQNIEDVSAMNTLARPASLVSGATNRYIEKRFAYVHKKFSGEQNPNTCEADKIFNEITKKTYGEIIYDEQKMKMVQQIGGLSLKDANLVRKDVKKWADKHDNLQAIFLKNALEKGWDNDKAKLYWEMVKQYSFCKAHSIAYSILGYWCAWAKYYHPVAFMKAMFLVASTDASSNKFNIIDAIKFARKIGYKVLPVNVNKSKSIFTFDDVKREIYFPFKSIKGVSEEAGKVIEKAAPFIDFNDFLLKTKSKVINKRIITPLIELRGFDDLNCKEQIRDYYLENFSLSKEEDASLRNSFKKDSEKKLLTKEERAKYKEELKQKAIAAFEQMYQTPLSMYELKHLGFILSIDLKKYENLLKDQVNPNMVEDDSTVFLYGFLSDIKNMKSKKGNYYGLIQIIDQNFNNFEIITKAMTIDNILQREQYKVGIGDFIRITVTKKGGRFFLKNEELIALNDCL